MESSRQKIEELRSVKEGDKEIAEKLALKLRPIYDFILAEFDARISELAKRNLLKPQARPEHNPYYKADIPLVVGGSASAKRDVWIRDVRFLNGGLIQLRFSQGQVTGGQVKEGLRMHWEGSVSGVRYRPLSFQFLSNEFTYGSDGRGGGRIYRPKTSDPLLDDEFRRTISTAIGDSIKFVYLNDAAAR